MEGDDTPGPRGLLDELEALEKKRKKKALGDKAGQDEAGSDDGGSKRAKKDPADLDLDDVWS